MKQLKTVQNNFFDTEFYENGETISLISIGIVNDANEYQYWVNKNFDYDAMVKDTEERGQQETKQFLDKHVFANLNATPENTISESEIADKLVSFCGDYPVFWAATASYDWIVLMQLYGTMMHKPDHWPFCPMDLAVIKKIFPELTEVSKIAESKVQKKLPHLLEHNALFDAFVAKEKYAIYKRYVETHDVGITLP